MFTVGQLMAHMIGDYALQSHWMAVNKRTQSAAAMFHVLFYAIPFLVLRPSPAALAVIVGTHFLIDRFGLARYVVWAKNFYLSLDRLPPPLTPTGFPEGTPVYVATWLLIIQDNLIHIGVNALALRFL